MDGTLLICNSTISMYPIEKRYFTIEIKKISIYSWRIQNLFVTLHTIKLLI